MTKIITPNTFKLGVFKSSFEFIDHKHSNSYQPIKRVWRAKLVENTGGFSFGNSVMDLVVHRTTILCDPVDNRSSKKLVMTVMSGMSGFMTDGIRHKKEHVVTLYSGIFGKPKRILRTLDLTKPHSKLFKAKNVWCGKHPDPDIDNGMTVRACVRRTELYNGAITTSEPVVTIYYDCDQNGKYRP